MKRIFIATCILCAVILSCKKKDKDPPKPSTTSTTTGGGSTTGGTTTGGTTTGGTTTGGTTTGGIGTPTNATVFNGFLTSMENIGSVGGFTFNVSTVMAYFSSDPVSFEGDGTGIPVEKVFFNGDSLLYQGSGEYLPDNASAIVLGSEKWDIHGANSIPTFTLENNIGKPSGFNQAAVPSTISKAAGVTINVGTLSNVKAGTIVISDGSSSISGTIVLPLTNGAQTIQLTPAQLSGMQVSTSSQSAIIMVMLENNMGLNILGKNFKLKKSLQNIKQITINN